MIRAGCWVHPRSSSFPALKHACTLVGVRFPASTEPPQATGGHHAEDRVANIDTTGGRDAYFRERDDDKKDYCFHINKIIFPDFSRRYS